jgi:hypothetical protein
MRVALVSRTVILVGWLAGVLWTGLDEPAGIAVAIALAALWAVALIRDRAEAA